jgi:hypothetical protein
MDVHHHSHLASGETPMARKKWTHYFWEFLMLFLAVFCGFLAEYQLEHKIEKDRAKELARSLYEELREDSVDMASKVQNRLRQEASLKWLMKYFKDSSLSHLSKAFSIHYLYGIHFRTPSLFEARTAILDQLKNSGSLRYFKSQKMQRLIGELSAAILYIKDRQDLETSVRVQLINPFTVEHYDYDFDAGITREGLLPFGEAVRRYEDSSEIIPFRLKRADNLDREATINMLGFLGMSGIRPTRQQHFQRYIELNEELLKELRKEYDLK